MLTIIFMGTPDFAKESLQAIYEAGHHIVGVVTNPDKQKGRGMKYLPSPVKEFALEKGLPIYQPESIKNNVEFIEQMKQLNPDVICVVAYGKLLPKELLSIAKLGCINLHGSILPKYRGAAPIQWAVLNGDKTTGVTTIYMDEGMDTGDMILKQEIQIGEEETTGELWNRLSKLGASLLVETLRQIEAGIAPREKQPKQYTLAPMLKKEMAKIDWLNQTAKEIKNLTRGLNPIMGAYTTYHGKKLKLWKVDIILLQDFVQKFPDTDSEINEILPGTILTASDKLGLYIKAKDDIIQVIEVQAENAKRMNCNEFLRGNSLEVGNKLE